MINVTSKNLKRACAAFSMLAAGLLLSIPAFSAQKQMEEVIIKAQRPTVKVIGRGDLGQPIKLIELSYHVRYGDLNLATSKGDAMLKKRVREAAISACKDLDKMYPLSAPDERCSLDAEDRAISQVEHAIHVAKVG